LPGTTTPPKRFWWSGCVVSAGRCDTPDCDCANEHNPAEAFAYTCGIHERLGLPELWLAAAPRECSEVPVMPGYELGRVLNRVTEGYVAGDFKPGEAVVFHGWPGGFAVKVVLETECVDVDELECWQAHPDAQVRPITWCAHREAER
jgi:hypothetical protein